MNTKCYCGHTATCDCEPQKILEDNIKHFENCIKSLDESFTKQETLEELIEERIKGINVDTGFRLVQQETLEEVAQKRFPINHNLSILERMGLNSAANMGFIEGAKWQAERMYSEEEVINLIKKALIHEPDDEIGALTDGKKYVRENNFNCWFEQFKKK
jgi:hypothetical protein